MKWRYCSINILFSNKKSAALLFLGLLFSTHTLYAEEFTSSSYKVLDPALSPSGFATSSSYQLWSSLSETAVGTSSSASYQAKSGFLSFPSITLPIISGTAGDGSAALSWTASQGYLGWTVTSYSVGQSTVSGGPYTYTNVGNTLSLSQNGLINGTSYYFVVVANDFFGNAVGTSTQIMVTPVAPVFTFSINTNTVYLGTLSTGATQFASSTNANGSSAEVQAHTVIVNTTANSGYTVSVRGQTLTSAQNQTSIIAPLLSNTAPSIGQEQFGMRLQASGGIGSVTTPYAASGFAFLSTATTSSQIASAVTGDNATTTYSVRYMSNITATSKAGSYSANLVFVATPNF